MKKIKIVERISLDGVIQAPAGETNRHYFFAGRAKPFLEAVGEATSLRIVKNLRGPGTASGGPKRLRRDILNMLCGSMH